MRRRSLLKSYGKSKGYIIQQPTAKTLTYDGTDQDLVNQGSATGVIMYSLDNVNFSNTIPQGKNASNYTVYYYAAESANYTQSDTYTIQCTIDKAAGYVSTAPTAKSLTYSGSAQALVNAGSGTGTMQYSLDNSSWNVSIPTGTNAGSYTVYYKVAASENYTESSAGSVGITISKATGSVTTAPTNKGVTYSGSAQTLANAGSGTGTMYYRLGTSGSFSKTIPTQTNAGSWTLYYYAAKSTNYTLSSTGSITVTIGKADQSAPTASGATTTYNTTATATASGGGGQGSIEWSNGNTQTSVGSKTTKARWAGNSNYNASAWSNEVTLKMNKASGSVTTAPTNRGVTYSGSNQNLVNAGSGTGTMYYKLNSGSWSTSIPVASAAGSYTVYYYAAASTNYTLSSTGSLTATIGKANQSAPSASGSTVTYGSTAYASASGGGGVGSIEWSNGSSRSAVGSQNTQARWTGNSNYNASGWSNSVTLKVNKANSGVKWTSAPTSVGDGGNCVTAAASRTAGDGSISYSSSNTGIATINAGGVITGKSTGSCTITATVAATTNYNSSSVSYTLYVNTYVDLGLPSGTKWACRNVGATSETAQGTFYQYGRGTSAYSNGASYTGTENPLNASKDAARVAWGTSWRSPTNTQLNELLSKTTVSFVTISGRYFLKCASSNGRYILLGVFGLMNGGIHLKDNTLAGYLSCSPGSSSKYCNILFLMPASNYYKVEDKNRVIGMLCRPVLA